MSFFKWLLVALSGGPTPVQCTWCGASNPGWAKVCARCGNPL